MADLESKLTGGKNISYVSDDDEDHSGQDPQSMTNDNPQVPTEGPQTGPKGVLEDYKQYKNLCRIEEITATKEKIELHKKIAFTADPNKHPEKPLEEEIDDDFEFDEDDDEFLKEYRQKRLAQMESKSKQNMEKFGELYDLQTSQELLNVM